MSTRTMVEPPRGRPEDVEDVHWALTTAASLWTQGEHDDAVAWVRRAAEAAADAGSAERFMELSSAADDLAHGLMAKIQEEPAREELVSLEEAELVPDSLEPSPAPPPPRRRRPPPPPPTIAPRPLQPANTPALGDAALAQADRSPRAPAAGRASPVRPVGRTVPVDVEASRPAESATPPDVSQMVVELAEPSFDDEPTTIQRSLLGSLDEEQLVEELRQASSFPKATTASEAPLAAVAPVAEHQAADEPVAYAPPTERLPAEEPSAEEPPAEAQQPVAAAPPVIEEPSTQSARNDEPSVGAPDADLSTVSVFEDLSDDKHAELIKSRQAHTLQPGEEISGFGLALVVRGSAAVMALVCDEPAVHLGPGEVLYLRGSFDDNVALRISAAEPDTQVWVWTQQTIDGALSVCPWVLDELRATSDRIQTLAAVSMGPMGERLDEALRRPTLERMEVRVLLGGEVLFDAGQPVEGLAIVGVGRLEVVGSGGVTQLAAGDLVFPGDVLSRSPAHALVRAAPGGATVLYAWASVVDEMMISVPPFLELLSTTA